MTWPKGPNWKLGLRPSPTHELVAYPLFPLKVVSILLRASDNFLSALYLLLRRPRRGEEMEHQGFRRALEWGGSPCLGTSAWRAQGCAQRCLPLLSVRLLTRPQPHTTILTCPLGAHRAPRPTTPPHRVPAPVLRRLPWLRDPFLRHADGQMNTEVRGSVCHSPL